MSFKTQELKDEAVVAQQLVVDASVGGESLAVAEEKLAEIKAEEVVA